MEGTDKVYLSNKIIKEVCQYSVLEKEHSVKSLFAAVIHCYEKKAF